MQMKRSGYTLMEVMIVIAIIGMILTTLTPKIKTIREGSNLRAGKDAIATALGTARAAAIQKGATATFHLGTDSTIMVDAVSNGATIPIMPKRSLGTLYSVGVTIFSKPATGTTYTASPGDTVIKFDLRGFGTTASDKQVLYLVKLGTKTDSICVTRNGLILKKGCFTQ
jgi:prepilin-type N-terminal cleavage/methylation domain-containing protein